MEEINRRKILGAIRQKNLDWIYIPTARHNENVQIEKNSISEIKMTTIQEDIWKILHEIAKGQKETAGKIAELFQAQEKTDEQMRKTDEQMRKTDEKLKRIGDMVDGIGKNQGFVAEEFFVNSLLDDPHLGGIHFDDIAKNEFKHRGKTQEEYDIVMTNGNAVGIIEVKYKAHEKDVDKLERKMRNFKILYPLYKDYKLYGAIAAFHFYDEAKEAALNRGFFVLQRTGKVVQTDCSENLLVL